MTDEKLVSVRKGMERTGREGKELEKKGKGKEGKERVEKGRYDIGKGEEWKGFGKSMD